ncbi:MAG: type II toxin-antitoxin system RelE/ParE family toxin [Caulobacteraceae bacterium]|nr:type II toxin-antitoxin system RelE/ParE family toxin [Caulobacteraceae bacterium]
MSRRSIVHASAALADLNDIWLSIAVDNRAAADRVIRQINRRFEMLADFPTAGVQRSDIHEALRQMVVSPYLILYRLASDDTVEIVRIVHGARDLHDL